MAEPSTRTMRSPWRGIRPRLIGILLVPTIAALGLGALRMQAAVSDSADANRAASVAAALPDSFRLAIQLTVERDAAVAGLPAKQLAQIRAGTDAEVVAWRSHLAEIDYTGNPGLRKELSAANDALGNLSKLRNQIVRHGTQASASAAYTTTLNTLFGVAGHVPSLNDESLYHQTDALAAIRPASESLGGIRIVMFKALSTGHVSRTDLIQLAAARSSWEANSERFYTNSSPAAQAGFDTISDGTAMKGAIGVPVIGAVGRLLQSGHVNDVGMTLQQWQAGYTDFVTKVQGVIIREATDLSAQVSDRRQTEQRTAAINAVVIFLVLLGALTAAMLAARSILRPLSRLRRAALDIAQYELPERVRQMGEAAGPVDTAVEPLRIGGRDEIGEVADAFDAVHAEAIRLAGEQASMRANVNRMFVNLSRRSQSLVERQLRLIDTLEANEQDPDDLANLFRLDHLATRMRRNDESLLVLAGGDSGQAGRGPVPVLDVLRAAASEIEQFARVEIESQETARFRGKVAGDLVHLLAELIENATNFSPPDTPVVVRTGRGGANGSLVIEILDLGIGMTPEELNAANAKLRRSSGLDADVARMMGLVVTSRLAERHGLVVELRDNRPRGVVARVTVPPSALDQPGTSAVPARPVEASPAYAPEPGRTPPAALPQRQAPVNPAARPMAPKVPEVAVTPQPPASPDPLTDPAITPAESLPAVVRSAVVCGSPDQTWFSSTVIMRDSAGRAPSIRWALGADPLGGERPDVRDEEASPIFSSLQSEWFTRRAAMTARSRAASQAATSARGLDEPVPVGQPADDWRSPGDDGWRRAAEVAARMEDAPMVTSGGLPVRVPGQNLIPGAAAFDTPPAGTAVPAAEVDRRRVRGLASFQQGVSRARNSDSAAGAADRPEGETQR